MRIARLAITPLAVKILMSLPSHRDHFPPEKCDLRRQRQVLRADVVAREQRHTAEDAVVIADQLEIVLIAAPVARVDTEAGDLIEPHGTDEILPHTRGAATGDAAAALELKGGLLLFADLAERDKERHVFGFVQLIGHHAGLASRLPRVEAENADLQLAVDWFIFHFQFSFISALSVSGFRCQVSG